MSTIKTKNSTTPSAVPSAASLSQGELAVNIADKKLFVGNASGDPVELTNQGVLSINGSTGAITNVAFTNVAQTFTATQEFTAGISASGGTFASAIRVDGFVDIGLGGGANSTNLMVGYNSLDANTTGLNNTAIGYNTLGLNQNGTSNLAVGSNALANNVSGVSNTALGSGALQYSTSNSNTAVGQDSLQSLGTLGLGVGSQNVAIGSDSAKSDSTGFPVWGITGCVMIGYDARPNANNGTNEIVIGYSGRGNGSNTTTIGNTSTTDAYIYGLLHLPDGISAANLAFTNVDNNFSVGQTFASNVIVSGNLTGATAAFSQQVTVGPLFGVNKTDPAYAADINAAAGNCLRLIYNSSSGSPTNYVNFAVSSSGDLTLTPSGGDVTMNANMGMNDKTLSRAELFDYFERYQLTSLTKGGGLTVDLSLGQVIKADLSANITSITISNIPDNGNSNAVGFTLILVADGTARTVTWPASVKWPGGTAPTLTSTNGKADIFSFVSIDAGTTWYGFVGGQNF